MNLCRLIIIAAILMTVLPTTLSADNGIESTSGMNVLFGAAIFLLILICFFVAYRIFSFLRGGELAGGWQMLAIAFIVLCLSQLIDIALSLELFTLDGVTVQVIRLLGVIVLMFGFVKIKNALS